MPKPPSEWAHLRLTDRIRYDLDVLFVGINPGVQSALTGHHFAGFSNRFWKLLHESGLAPMPLTPKDDVRLPEWGYGVTNLVARPSPGIDDLKPAEYLEGWKTLQRKIRRYRPRIVAFVGVTLYRVLLPVLITEPEAAQADREIVVRSAARISIPGPQPFRIHGAQLFVLPNPSGRNANFTYGEMLDAFRLLKREVARMRGRGLAASRPGRR
jgi:TDG/mug DNA glycosylase family protein